MTWLVLTMLVTAYHMHGVEPTLSLELEHVSSKQKLYSIFPMVQAVLVYLPLCESQFIILPTVPLSKLLLLSSHILCPFWYVSGPLFSFQRKGAKLMMSL